MAKPLFALPDLRGRVPVGTGTGPGLPNIVLGELSGTPSTTLLITNMPAHNHIASGTGLVVSQSASTAAATTNIPGSTLVPAQLPTIGGGPSATTIEGYAPQDNSATLAQSQVSGTLTTNIAGGSQPFFYYAAVSGNELYHCRRRYIPQPELIPDIEF